MKKMLQVIVELVLCKQLSKNKKSIQHSWQKLQGIHQMRASFLEKKNLIELPSNGSRQEKYDIRILNVIVKDNCNN